MLWHENQVDFLAKKKKKKVVSNNLFKVVMKTVYQFIWQILLYHSYLAGWEKYIFTDVGSWFSHAINEYELCKGRICGAKVLKKVLVVLVPYSAWSSVYSKSCSYFYSPFLNLLAPFITFQH